MRRILAVAASASVLVAIGLLVWITVTAPPADAAGRAERIAGELRCPDCEALSVADSRTNAAAAIRAEIERQVAAGASDDGIRAYFVERYGEWILMAPTDPMAWWVPVLAVLTAITVFAAWLVGPRRSREPRSVAAVVPAPPLTDVERQRVRDELELLDG